MTLPRDRFQVKTKKCRSCGNWFTTILEHAGRPPNYCKRCRKDYTLYPGATRRMRDRINHDAMVKDKAFKRMLNEVIAQRIGHPKEDE